MSKRRYFTLEEANAMLPWLEESFRRILMLRAQLGTLHDTLENLGYRPGPQLFTGHFDGNEEVRSARAKFMGLMELLQEDLAKVSGQGIEVKDLETGLCDFWSTSIVEGQPVYLCWRYGEKAIRYYHDPESGFAGRKPIPASQNPKAPSPKGTAGKGTEN
jgi:hypothetical protein